MDEIFRDLWSDDFPTFQWGGGGVVFKTLCIKKNYCVLDPAVHGRGRRRLIGTLFRGWTSEKLDSRVEIQDFKIIECHSKNCFCNHEIASEKRDFQPAPRVSPVYPNQLGASHYESFGISSKLDEGFLKSCLKDLHWFDGTQAKIHYGSAATSTK